MKKLITFIIVCIWILGAIIGYIKGFNVGLVYKKSVSFDVYVGEKVEDKDINDIAKEILNGKKFIVQKIEVFEDMISLTTTEMKNKEIKEVKKALASKLNEKYNTEIKSSNIVVRHNPKIRLIDTAKPYIQPFAIVIALILIYQAIRFRKLGVFKILGTTVGAIVVTELTFLFFLIVTRLPYNRLTIPFGILLFVGAVLGTNIYNEKRLENIK